MRETNNKSKDRKNEDCFSGVHIHTVALQYTKCNRIYLPFIPQRQKHIKVFYAFLPV